MAKKSKQRRVLLALFDGKIQKLPPYGVIFEIFGKIEAIK